MYGLIFNLYDYSDRFGARVREWPGESTASERQPDRLFLYHSDLPVHRLLRLLSNSDSFLKSGNAQILL